MAERRANSPNEDRSLAYRARVLDGDHSDPMTERNNLADANQRRGWLGEAIPPA